MLTALRQMLDPTLFWEYRVVLLKGLVENLSIFAESAILAMATATIVAVVQLGRNRPIKWIATGYTELCRNTPEYVLLVWVYFVLPLIVSKMIGSRFRLDPHVAAVIGLGVAYSGFMAETLRAGLRSIHPGQAEAATAIGMSPFKTLRRIILPQALRRTLPDIVNQLVSLFKSTTIVSLITVQDIMYQVSMISVAEMRPIPLYTGAALLYCAVIIAATQTFHGLTERWRRRGWS
jgi:polar amino acid transport system permease protein